jgi:hypothetical protein
MFRSSGVMSFQIEVKKENIMSGTKHKVVVITGAISAIGGATARQRFNLCCPHVLQEHEFERVGSGSVSSRDSGS